MSGSARLSVAVSEMEREGQVREAPSEEKLGGENGFRFSLDSALSTVELPSE